MRMVLLLLALLPLQQTDPDQARIAALALRRLYLEHLKQADA